MIRSSYNFVDFDTIFFIGPLGVGNTDTSPRKKKTIDASISHSSINTVKSDVSSVFASNSSEGDNEMSSSGDAAVAVTMRGHTAAYQSKNTTSRLSKIPVPGAAGPPKTEGGLRRVNSMRANIRSAPSSGHTTPVPPEQNKVVYRNKAGRLAVNNDDEHARNRLSLNEQTFRSLPSSANSSPSNKRRNGSLSAAPSTNSLTVTSETPKGRQNAVSKKTGNHLLLTKTSSASTPEEVRKAKEKEKSKDVFTRLTKPSGNKQKAGTPKSILVPSSSRSHSQCSSRSHSQCSSRSESPIEQNTYTAGNRRSTMPSRVPKSNKVTKEASALAKLASRITQWAQRTQNEPESNTTVKPQQTKKLSTKSYQSIPVRRTPSPYDRTTAPPVRRSSFKLKGSRGSTGSIGSVSTTEAQLTHAGDTNLSNFSDREVESPFSDTENPLVPSSPVVVATSAIGGVDSSSLESSTAYVESSCSSLGSTTATPTTVIKKSPRDVNHHSPYFIRMSAASSSKTPAGELDQLIGELNLEEIEGAVSIEADEYRRMAQEVKALKTVLLKLKRELQADVSHCESLICIKNLLRR